MNQEIPTSVWDRPESDRIKNIRREAWNRYRETEIPGRIELPWRFTDPASFVYPGEPAEAGGHTSEPAESGTQPFYRPSDPAVSLTFRTGASPAGSYKKENHSSVPFLFGALKDHQREAESSLGELSSAQTGKFEALNLAVWREGFFLSVPDNTVLEKPIFLSQEIGAQGYLPFRSLVRIGKNCSVRIIDLIYGGGNSRKEESVCNRSSEIYVGAGSKVNYITQQDLGAGGLLYHNQTFRLDSDVSLFATPLSSGGKGIKHHLESRIRGNNIESKLEGFLFGKSLNRFDYYVGNEHYGTDSVSNINIHSVLQERSYSACRGRINIHEKAKNSEAYQENRNLLLAKACRADSVPELDIRNDEVVCSHGSVTSSIDPLELFYLKSRGLEEADAVGLLIEGFLLSALNDVPPFIRDYAGEYTKQRLRVS